MLLGGVSNAMTHLSLVPPTFPSITQPAERQVPTACHLRKEDVGVWGSKQDMKVSQPMALAGPVTSHSGGPGESHRCGKQRDHG